MQKPTDIFAADRDDPEPAGQPPQRPGARQRGIRFEFANGATPLEGYTIKRGIGVGGFGDVYYAVTDAGKDVAIKRIQRNLDVELRGVRQCLNLKHPNLIALYDIRYDDDENPWVVMEYVAGESLQEVIDRNPNGLPLDQVDFWFTGLAAGIGYLHDCGIVHRDIKPANLFLDEGTVKIGDYGLAKFISCSRRSGQTQSVGTFHYMAPEIGQGRYGKEIDIYALGIVLYEMLSGRVPFDGESSQEIIMKHLTSAPQLGDLPAKYQPVIAGALRKDADQRTDSVAEMCHQLQLPCTSSVRLGGHRASVLNDRRDVILAEAVEEVRQPGSPGTAAAPAAIIPDEPIARALYLAGQNVRNSWNQLQWSAPLKLCLALFAVYLLGRVGPRLLPLLITACCVYGVYRLLRSLALAERVPSNPAAQAGTPGTVQAAAGRTPIDRAAALAAPELSHPTARRRPPVTDPALKKKMALQQARRALADKPLRQHLAELSGAFLLAAFASFIASLAIQLFITKDLGASYLAWGPACAWTACITTLTAWMILAAAKFWEGSADGAGLRRFTLLVGGLGIGLVAWELSQWLMVSSSYLADWPRPFGPHKIVPDGFYDLSGMPQFPAYLAFFGGLMAIPRWWKQADPLRRTRLSLWAIGITTVLVMGYQLVCPFPRGFLLAGAVAIAVQVAAPWLNQRKRTELSEMGAQP